MNSITTLCDICGKLAKHTCRLCGKRVCDEHFDKRGKICSSCMHGRG